MNVDSPDYGFWPGEVSYRCEISLRNMGPKDSTSVVWIRGTVLEQRQAER